MIPRISNTRAWKTILVSVLFVTLLGAATRAALAQEPEAIAADRDPIGAAIAQSLEYLASAQLPDGSIEGWTPGVADEFTTVKAALALAAASRPMSYLTSLNGKTPLDFLAGQAITFTHDISGVLLPGRAGMIAVAAIAGDLDASDFGGADLVGELAETLNPATGAYSTTAKLGWSTGAASATNQAWAMLALAAAQRPVPQVAIDFLAGLIEPDGGWGYGLGGDVDTTSLAIQALVAANVDPSDELVQGGLAFLSRGQARSGGWESWGALSADSTAAAMQAIAAAGFVPVGPSWETRTGRTPADDLLGMQMPDSSFGNALGTAHAIAGLAEAPLPIWGRRQRALRALSWMQEQQADDGSWISFAGAAGATCDAVLAFAATGIDPSTLAAASSGATPTDFLASQVESFAAAGPDNAGKLVVAIAAAGMDPGAFGGSNVVDLLTSHYSPTLGGFGVITNTWHQSWGVLGLAAAGEAVPLRARENLAQLQQPDGGWKYDLSPSPWNTTTPDNTGLAMQALIAAGLPPSAPVLAQGIAYLGASQDDMGGWFNSNSTAYAMQGLVAAGEDLAADWTRNGHTPYNALASYQKRDGPFIWAWDSAWSGPVDDSLSTWQAIPALIGAPYPLRPGRQTQFEAVQRGADPDRMVIGRPTVVREGDVAVLRVPIGGDVDQDGSVQVAWRVYGQEAWSEGSPAARATGLYSATVPLPDRVSYEFRLSYADPDLAQDGPSVSETLTRRLSLRHYWHRVGGPFGRISLY